MKVELSETFKQILVFTKGNLKRRVRKIRILRLRELRVIRWTEEKVDPANTILKSPAKIFQRAKSKEHKEILILHTCFRAIRVTWVFTLVLNWEKQTWLVTGINFFKTLKHHKVCLESIVEKLTKVPISTKCFRFFPKILSKCLSKPATIEVNFRSCDSAHY